ncbi:hypothetical protein [Haloactinomyces albus]|uniref:Uncharacterized protein n=1 Tax=Haloactinomyces albus TaxID=1352928 RepID=A0AAE3ZF85_9ACTN|nr:hypothetical protein [Haloactinomyces albus]MDR7302464.1 hypothetical protein [Haloactinomyces albus]
MIIGIDVFDEEYSALCSVGGQPCRLHGVDGQDSVVLRWLSRQPAGAETDTAAALGLIGSGSRMVSSRTSRWWYRSNGPKRWFSVPISSR